jgi:hypothetical protein
MNQKVTLSKFIPHLWLTSVLKSLRNGNFWRPEAWFGFRVKLHSDPDSQHWMYWRYRIWLTYTAYMFLPFVLSKQNNPKSSNLLAKGKTWNIILCKITVSTSMFSKFGPPHVNIALPVCYAFFHQPPTSSYNLKFFACFIKLASRIFGGPFWTHAIAYSEVNTQR